MCTRLGQQTNMITIWSGKVLFVWPQCLFNPNSTGWRKSSGSNGNLAPGLVWFILGPSPENKETLFSSTFATHYNFFSILFTSLPCLIRSLDILEFCYHYCSLPHWKLVQHTWKENFFNINLRKLLVQTRFKPETKLIIFWLELFVACSDCVKIERTV